jgi:hypothetical protein
VERNETILQKLGRVTIEKIQQILRKWVNLTLQNVICMCVGGGAGGVMCRGGGGGWVLLHL